jgi:ABC-2 type transport system permease protein
MLWALLTFSFSNVAKSIYGKDLKKAASTQMVKNVIPEQGKELKSTQESADMDAFQVIDEVKNSVNIPMLIGCFLFFYFFGYLLYSSLFAAIGSAVESAAEAQQFTFPVTIPIILSFVLAQYTIQDPSSTVAFWASIIPFTSPINMIVRLPYGVPMSELFLSMALLVMGFFGTAALSARIYRVGILMYGKKMSWKELGKWLFYKN